MNSIDKKLNNEIEMLWKLKRKNDGEIEILLQDPKVREFLNLYKNNEEVSKLIDKKQRELLHHRFETCNHAYVMTDVSMANGYTPIYKCVKCGLTNESLVRGNQVSLSYPYSLMGDIFEQTFHKSVLIYDGLNDVPFEEIAKIYEIVTTEYPNISLIELRENIKREVSVIREMLIKK